MNEDSLFVVNDEQYDALLTLLEQPARDLPRLRATVRRPSPFAEVSE